MINRTRPEPASGAPTFLSWRPPRRSFDCAYLLMDASAGHSTSKLRAAAGRYLEARRSLHTPASAQSRRGLDWMNFFIADAVQTGFGAFVAFLSLAQFGWSPTLISGLRCPVGGVAGMTSQDSGRCARRRGHLEARLGGRRHYHDRCRSANFRLRAGHGVGVHRASIAGCNCRHHHAGDRRDQSRSGRTKRHVGAHREELSLFRRRPCTDRRADGASPAAYIAVGSGAIFVAAAALCIPALIALSFIRSDEIDYARARNAKSTKQSNAKGSASKQAGGKPAVTATSILALAKNRELVLFTAAIVLFQLADTSMLPMMGANLALTRGDHAAIWMSGLIVVP